MCTIKKLSNAWLLVGLGVTLCAPGCGDQGVRYAPVAGIVTVDGKPIGRAEVVLLCDETSVRPRPTSRGVTNTSGRFVVRSLTPQKKLIDGAVVGKHRVVVTTRVLEQDARGNTRVVREELLGKDITDGEALTAHVPPTGIEELRFDLKSK
jgi:hypothetical protein